MKFRNVRLTVSRKLFLITALLLTVILACMMLFQTFFFPSYYKYKNISQFEKGLGHFSGKVEERLKNPSLSLEEVQALFPEFEQTYQADVVLLDLREGVKIILNPWEQQETHQFTLHRQDDDRMIIQSVPLANGNQRNALSLAQNWVSRPEDFNKVLQDRKRTVYETRLPGLDFDQIIGASPVVIGDQVHFVLMAARSLQPVGDAASAIRDMYVYFILLAAGLVVLASFVYSRMISKPLLQLNRTATRMAKLDFSARSDLSRRDEIGNLAHTLNFLSANLRTTLDDLQEANEKLKEDIEREKELERLRKDFVAGVSHELKTPISLIRGYAEGLQDNVAKDRRDPYTNVIIEETRRMSALVQDMLDLSQLESGRFSLNWQPIPMIDFLQEILRKYSALYQDRPITFQWELPESLPAVNGDPARLEQVMANLISNAVRHTVEGGVITIGVEVMGGEGQANTVRVEVYNEGEPIPEEELPLIWEKFYRTDKSGSRDFGGTGLGLSIVKNILIRHGSAYGVENRSEGVAFHFTLPAAPE